ncbi:hypothetical protein BGZ98_004109 [Dissophora globulifera]|nr:hypothetical protein BGZ98_004109 [Dissophora globulifera]
MYHALTGSDNELIYNTSVKSLVQSAMEGYNGTVFAYGQTSSGKTYTMSGTERQPGITPRAVEDVFKYIRENSEREFLLRVSYLEIYNESIRDLLSPEAIDLRIHEDRRVIESRERAPTAPRSPTGGRRLSFGLKSPSAVRVSQLNLIDLAGSEKASSDVERRKEGAFINKSLLTLGTVISKLTDDKGSHIPYRDSKLTRILQSSLSGNARVSVICTISPSFLNVDESHNTLKFAARVKKVVTKAHTNQVMDDKALLEKYRREISELKAQLLLTLADSGSGGGYGGGGEGDGSGPGGLDKGKHAELSHLLERERMKHEEEMIEMNLVRNALKERIDHLTKLILTSQSINNKPTGNTPSGGAPGSSSTATSSAAATLGRYTVETTADGGVMEFPREIESRLARKDTIVRQLQSQLEVQQEKVMLMKNALQRTAKGEIVDIEKTLAKVEMESEPREKFLIEKRASIMSTSNLNWQDGARGDKTLVSSPDGTLTEDDNASILLPDGDRLAIEDDDDDNDLLDTPWNRAELISLRQAKRELEIVVIEQEKKLEEVVSFEDSDDFRNLVLEMEEQREKILAMEEEREGFKTLITELRNSIRRLELRPAGAGAAAPAASSPPTSPSANATTTTTSASRVKELEALLQKEHRQRMEEQARSMGRIASLEAEVTILRAEQSVRELE